MNRIDALKSDRLIDSANLIGTPEALRKVLLRSQEVRDVRAGFINLELDKNHLRKFVDELFKEFLPNRYFQGDISLCALAAALELVPGDFVEEFIQELIRLKIAEAPMCSKVASLCLVNRNSILSTTTHKNFRLSSRILPETVQVQEASEVSAPILVTEEAYRLVA